MDTTNLIVILSDEHSRDAAGCYGHPLARTPHIDGLAARGTRFLNGYTNCPICIPARASIATGEYVHDTGYWDNGQAYDGRVRSWHHELRENGIPAVSVGKLHFKGNGTDHGFSEEIDPLHVVDGIGDVLGCIRDDMPRRHKRPGIEAAGAGNSTYIEYDASNADKAIEWLKAHTEAPRPWVLFIGFVLPHPPYIAPESTYVHFPLSQLGMPPQWQESDWPDHPVIATFRRAFDFDAPFSEDTVRRVNAAYLGACEYVDSQIGRVLSAVDRFGLNETTRILYTSDHGEDRGARGLFGKFTMYEESAGIPMIFAGPDIPKANTIETPVSLIDIYPTVLQAMNLSCDSSKPGRSLIEIASDGMTDRIAFSEYHALGCTHGFYMIRSGKLKYVHYVDAPAQLFNLGEDPLEFDNRAEEPFYAETVRALESSLRAIVDPRAADRAARADQARVVEGFGGRDAVIGRGAFDNSPVPGEDPQFHI